MKRFIVPLLFVAAASFTACVDDFEIANPPQADIEVDVDESGIHFPKEKGGVVEFAISGTHPLIMTDIEYLPNGSTKNEKWLTVTIVSSKLIRVNCTLDNYSPGIRKAIVKVSSGYGETTTIKDIEVTQAVFPATLSIDKNSATVKNLPDAGFEVVATTNQESITTQISEADAQWLDATIDGMKVTITAKSKNMDPLSDRVGVVNIIGGTAPNNVITLPVTVTQGKFGAPVVTVAQTKDTLANTIGAVSTLALETEEPSTTTISVAAAAQSWLKAELNAEKTLVTLTTLSANTATYANRTGVVTISAGSGAYIANEEIIVLQMGKTIAVGDALNGGFVFYVAGDQMSYKVAHPTITSLTQVANPCLAWATTGTTGATTLIGCSDMNDGRVNVEVMKTLSADLSDFPAAKYCNELTTDGGGWYLPARNELYTELFGAWSTYNGDVSGAAFDLLFTGVGGTATISAGYGFSSTESSAIQATCIRFSAYGSAPQNKNGTNNRASRCIKVATRISYEVD